MQPFGFHAAGAGAVPRPSAGAPPPPALDAQALRFRKMVAVERAKYGSADTGKKVASPTFHLRPLTVCVRKRPINTEETHGGHFDVVTVPHPSTTASGTANALVVHEPKLRYDLQSTVTNHDFHFDRVFSESTSNGEVYRAVLGPCVKKLVTGQQVTVFAYGQTGSGKSYTMTGLCDRAMADIFTACASEKSSPYAVCISFYEIYCSKAFDLLADRQLLAIREDEDHAMQVVGLTEHSTCSMDIARALVAKGLSSRSSGATKVNADSSRSHAILTLLLRHKESKAVMGKLTLVDLAGSEQAHESAPSDRQAAHEGAEINKSLLALKECIRAMGRGQRQRRGARGEAGPSKEAYDVSEEEERRGERRGEERGGPAKRRSRSTSARPAPARPYPAPRRHPKKVPHNHIPFRGSKLTQVLRDCFTTAGAVTIMIATVSPSSLSTDHSLNTLRYADRLKEVGRWGEEEGVPAAVCDAASAAPYPPALVDNVAGMRVGVLWNGGKEIAPVDGIEALRAMSREGELTHRKADSFATVAASAREVDSRESSMGKDSRDSVSDASEPRPSKRSEVEVESIPTADKAAGPEHHVIYAKPRHGSRKQHSESEALPPPPPAPAAVEKAAGKAPRPVSGLERRGKTADAFLKPTETVTLEQESGEDGPAPNRDDVLALIDAQIQHLNKLRCKVVGGEESTTAVVEAKPGPKAASKHVDRVPAAVQPPALPPTGVSRPVPEVAEETEAVSRKSHTPLDTRVKAAPVPVPAPVGASQQQQQQGPSREKSVTRKPALAPPKEPAIARKVVEEEAPIKREKEKEVSKQAKDEEDGVIVIPGAANRRLHVPPPKIPSSHLPQAPNTHAHVYAPPTHAHVHLPARGREREIYSDAPRKVALSDIAAALVPPPARAQPNKPGKPERKHSSKPTTPDGYAYVPAKGVETEHAAPKERKGVRAIISEPTVSLAGLPIALPAPAQSSQAAASAHAIDSIHLMHTEVDKAFLKRRIRDREVDRPLQQIGAAVNHSHPLAFGGPHLPPPSKMQGALARLMEEAASADVLVPRRSIGGGQRWKP